ncbi:hypothetical protein [Streptomyces sp. NPDC050804]
MGCGQCSSTCPGRPCNCGSTPARSSDRCRCLYCVCWSSLRW